MKRYIFAATLIPAMAVTGNWNFNESKNEIGLSDLASTNVKALVLGPASNVKGTCSCGGSVKANK